MKKDNIVQKIALSGRATVKNIVQIGKIVIQPSKWQDEIWEFVCRHPVYFVSLLIGVIVISLLFLLFRDPYLIPVWKWALAIIFWAIASWNWYSRKKEQYQNNVSIWVAILATVCLIVLIGWQTLHVMYPKKFGPNTFGIIFANLGRSSFFFKDEEALQLSDYVYEHLQNNLPLYSDNEMDFESSDTPKYEYVQLMRIGFVDSTDKAQRIGKKQNADVVVWGNLLSSVDGRTVIYFEVLETPDYVVTPDFPLVLPVTTFSTNLFIDELDPEKDIVNLRDSVEQEAIIITSFTTGLAAYLSRDFPLAANQFLITHQVIENQTTLKISPSGKSLIYFYLGRANNYMGRFADGQEWLHKAYTENPDEPAIPLSLALGYNSLGDNIARDKYLNAALSLLDDWLVSHPKPDLGDSGYENKLAERSAALYDRGIIHQVQEEYHTAFLDFSSLLDENPDFYIAYLNKGQVAAELGLFDEAESALETAIEIAKQRQINPTWVHLNLAWVYEKANDPDLAKNQYRQALNSDPDEAWTYYYYGNLLANLGETDAALLAYRNLIQAAKKQGWDEGWAYGITANFYAKQGLLEQAKNYYEMAIYHQPEDVLLLSRLAETYQNLGDYERALATYEKAVALGKPIYYVYASYAGLLYQLQDYKQAIHNYQKALDLRPNDPAILFNLGLTYESLGEFEQAKLYYQRIIDMDELAPQDVLTKAKDRLVVLEDEQP